MRPTADQVMSALECDDNIGFCLACGAERGGVEPDARNYECDDCGEYRVFGAEECLLFVGVL